MTCPSCHAAMNDDSRFCPSCGTAVATAAPSPPSLLGQTLEGGYLLTRVLHRGLVSTVYLAEQQLRDGARSVVVKVLESREPEENWRFIGGAGISSRLENRHNVSAIDLGSTTDDRRFVVMPLVVGQPISPGPMPFPRVAHALGQLCIALEEIHALSLVYLHIKPGHLLLDANDTLFLIDYSSASKVGAPVFGEVPGATAYISPEQAAGEPHDARSDVYSMAALAHDMLTGSPPFRPSEGLPALPGPMQHALAIGLARAPSSRFRSVTELFTALTADG